MKQLHIIVDDNGRSLKNNINALIKSGACSNIFVQNYVHQYSPSDTKKLTKTQHKHIIINYFDEQIIKLVQILDKNLLGRKDNHRTQEISKFL